MSALKITLPIHPKTKPKAIRPTGAVATKAAWDFVMAENRRCDARCPGVLEGIKARIGGEKPNG